MWQTIVTTAVTVTVSLLITLFFNGIVNLPKKKREEENKKSKEAEDFRNEIKRLISNYSDQNMKELGLCRIGLQAVIKNELKVRYEKWIELGYAPLDAKDDLERMYQVYHQLGANGVMDSIRAKFLALPDAPQKTI